MSSFTARLRSVGVPKYIGVYLPPQRPCGDTRASTGENGSQSPSVLAWTPKQRASGGPATGKQREGIISAWRRGR